MNKVFLNKKGIVEENFGKRQTFRTIMSTAAKLMYIVDNLPKGKRRVNVLVDMSNVKSVTPDAMIAGVDTMKTDFKGKAAIFGGNKMIHGLASILIAAAGKEKRVRIFDSKEDAEMWLLHGS